MLAFPYSLALVVMALVLLPSKNDAFTTSVIRRTAQAQATSPVVVFATADDASSKALTEYMVKSHEEKLRAIKDVEDKKNAELAALRAELEALKESKDTSSSALTTTVSPPPPEGSKEELAAKLMAYQKFMADYIVKSQEEKLRAIKDTEDAMQKKMQETMLKLGGTAEPAPAVAPAAPTNPLYAGRNENIKKAAKAGKSRWGDMEVQRIQSTAGSPPPLEAAKPVAPAAASSSATVMAPPPLAVMGEIPPEVVAADHGLRADGGVGGLTLAERVAYGSQASAAAAAASPARAAAATSAAPGGAVSSSTGGAGPMLYYKRNAMVSAAGAAGKSRWGSMEISKAAALAAQGPPELSASSTSAAELVVTPEIQAADHGLRADGGVSGPSLAERVNLGAALLGA